MDPELEQRFTALEEKVGRTLHSVEALRRYATWTLIVTFIVIVVPLLAMAFVLPQFFGAYEGLLQ
jgi:type II secretory pathway component PulF